MDSLTANFHLSDYEGGAMLGGRMHKRHHKKHSRKHHRGGYMLGGYVLGGKGTAEGAAKAREKRALKRASMAHEKPPKEKKMKGPTLKELRKEAKELGLHGYSKMNKKEVEYLIQNHEQHHEKYHHETQNKHLLKKTIGVLHEVVKSLEFVHDSL